MTFGRYSTMIGRFCKRALLKRLYSAKETYHYYEAVNGKCKHNDIREIFDTTTGWLWLVGSIN